MWYEKQENACGISAVVNDTGTSDVENTEVEPNSSPSRV
jgi:hypothetical protein